MTTRRWLVTVAGARFLVALVRAFPTRLIDAAMLTALFGPILGGDYLRRPAGGSSVRSGAFTGAVSSLIALGLFILWVYLAFDEVPRLRFWVARRVVIARSVVGVVSLGALWGGFVGLVILIAGPDPSVLTPAPPSPSDSGAGV